MMNPVRRMLNAAPHTIRFMIFFISERAAALPLKVPDCDTEIVL